MFLACENLAAPAGGGARDTPPRPANTALAAEFERYVVLVPKFRPFASEHDVARLVELLAAQDVAGKPAPVAHGPRPGVGDVGF